MGGRLFIESIEGRRVQEELAFPFDQPRVLIGRSGAADVRLPHRTVSERHASLEWASDHYKLTDHGSTNGTRVGGERLVPHRGKRLKEGDRVELGIYVLTFHNDVLVTAPLTSERTAELARRLLRRREPEGDGVSPQPPRLVVVSGPLSGHSLDLPDEPERTVVGRDAGCALCLPDENLAAEELVLTRDLDGVLAQALDPGRPFAVGRKSGVRHRLKDGDEVLVGSTMLLFEEPAEAALGALAQDEDEPVRLRPAPAPEPEQAAEAEATPAAAEDSSQNPRPERVSKPRVSQPAPKTLGADLLVYGLASIILSLSIAGLVLLLRSH